MTGKEALEASIKKWEAIVNDGAADRGSRDCPLCQKYKVAGWCDECPVRAVTGMHFCTDSPYDEWHAYWPRIPKVGIDDESRRLAQAELDFLRSL